MRMRRFGCAAVSLLALLLPEGANSQEAGSSEEPSRVLHSRAVEVDVGNGIFLPGTLSFPVSAGTAKSPAALLIQGSGPTNRDGNQPPALMPDLLKKIAFTLAKGGVASLRFDKRGLGGKLPSRADELAEFARWENFVDDSMAAYRFLASQPEIDGRRVAVLGHSEGAMLALEVSARLQQHNPPPAAIVLVAAPGRRMDVVLRSQLAALGERQGGGAAAKAALAEVDRAIASIRASGQVPSDLAPNVAPIFPAYLGPFMRSWFAVDTPRLAKAYAGPVLLIFGEQDAQLMPHEDARLIEAGLSQRPKDEHETLYVAGASHNLKLLSGSDGIDGILAPAASLKLRSWLAAKLANPGQR